MYFDTVYAEIPELGIGMNWDEFFWRILGFVDLGDFSEFGNKILNFLPVFRGDLQGFQYGACSSTGRLTCGNPWEKAAWLENVWISTVFLFNENDIFPNKWKCHPPKPVPNVISWLLEMIECKTKLKSLWKSTIFNCAKRLPVSSQFDATRNGCTGPTHFQTNAGKSSYIHTPFSHSSTGKMKNGGSIISVIGKPIFLAEASTYLEK